MARPPNADAEATRNRVLDRALALFAERGVDGVSIREVAREASVSLAMVHHYYGSKDGLFDACVAAMYDELAAMRTELVAALAAGGPLPALIERAVGASYRFARSHRVAVRLLIRATVDSGRLNPRGRALLLEFLDAASSALGEALGQPAAALRLPLQSLVFLVARYAAQDEAELAAVVGDGAADAVAAVERHLAALAVAALTGAAAPPPERRAAGAPGRRHRR